MSLNKSIEFIIIIKNNNIIINVDLFTFVWKQNGIFFKSLLRFSQSLSSFR